MCPLTLTGMTDKLSRSQVSAQDLTRQEDTTVLVLGYTTWGATVQGISNWAGSNRYDRQNEQANLCSNSHGSDEDALHPEGREEGLQVACQPERNRLAALQNAPVDSKPVVYTCDRTLFTLLFSCCSCQCSWPTADAGGSPDSWPAQHSTAQRSTAHSAAQHGRAEHGLVQETDQSIVMHSIS